MSAPKKLSEVKRSVFRNLFVFMIAFGILVGLVFPLFANIVLAKRSALSVQFYALSTGAGLLVGLINFLLFDRVVSRDLNRVVKGMREVLESVKDAETLGEGCQERYQLEITSRDAIGEIETSFNDMTEAIARRLKKESVLRVMNARLADSVTPGEAAETVLSTFVNACSASAGLIFGNSGGEFTLLSAYGVEEAEKLPGSLDLLPESLRRALEENRMQACGMEGEGEAQAGLFAALAALHPRQVWAIPLVVKGGQVGLVILASGQEELCAGQLEMLEALRGQAAPYLSNAFLHQKFADLAAIDDLTRLLTRRFGLLRLREEFSRAVRHGGALSVMLVDIDQFEQINDTYGHMAGDRMLRSIAGVLEANIRAEDVLCRYEGDEFLVITPGTGLVDSALLGERLRLQVEQNEVEWGEGRLSVSISVGVAAWPIARITGPEELINYADQSLYNAKESGGNCTSAWCNHRALKLAALEQDARVEPLFS